ncbi:hypothetical protein TrispH2_010413 [Trichoplax sp. H2]|nr:hypothetical protein TrispH2_010413 [Trichoplax sp. H2]|eukprot:RDD37972.1 hypothetical protein TrispH2_010413 [Trichoplax sp. H2]
MKNQLLVYSRRLGIAHDWENNALAEFNQYRPYSAGNDKPHRKIKIGPAIKVSMFGDCSGYFADDYSNNDMLGLYSDRVDFRYWFVSMDTCNGCFADGYSNNDKTGLLELSSSISNFVVVVVCDLDINRYNKGWLSLAFKMGLTSGAGIFGRLANTYGRRRILIIA